MTEPTYRPRRRARSNGAADARPKPQPAPAKPAAPQIPALETPSQGAWSLRELLGVLGLTLVISITEVLLLSSDAATSLPVTSGVVVRGAVVLVYYTILLAFVWWLAERRGMPFPKGVGLRGFDAGPAALAVVGYLVVVRLAGFAYTVLLVLARVTLPGSGTDPSRFFGASSAGAVFTVAVVGFVGPFVEEVAFRGVVFGALSDVMPVWAAIAVSATLFALFHFNVFLFVPTLIAGVGLAMMYRREGSLWPAIMLHSAYNVTSIVLAWVLRGYLGS